MATANRLRGAFIAGSAFVLLSCASTGNTVKVWKVGSPHLGDTSPAVVSVSFTGNFGAQGLAVDVEAFPAKGFAARFADAVRQDSPPDLLVVDNYGIIDGITTRLGTFDGIAQDQNIRGKLIRIAGSFDDVLPPQRGWTFSFAQSKNYDAIRKMALATPQCPSGTPVVELPEQLRSFVPGVVAALLKRDSRALEQYSDPDRLTATPTNGETARLGLLRTCGIWGNDKLLFLSVQAAFEAEHSIGRTLILLVLRRSSAGWHVLVASRDVISNKAFVQELPGLAALLTRGARSSTPPSPPTLQMPANGDRLQPARNERFGNFVWQPSGSQNVVAEIVEFTYGNEARLFLRRGQDRTTGRISAGQLVHTGTPWKWRVWSVTAGGDVGFSAPRSFPS